MVIVNMIGKIKGTIINDIIGLQLLTALLSDLQPYFGLVFAILFPFVSKNGWPYARGFIRINIKYILVKNVIAIIYVLSLWYIVLNPNVFFVIPSWLLSSVLFFWIGLVFFLLFLVINSKLWDSGGE